MVVLIYGDSLTQGLVVDQGAFHVESRPGYTTQNFVAEEEQKIGLSMLLNEDHYDHLVLIMGTNDPQDSESDIQESMNNIQTLLHVAIAHPRRPSFLSISTTMINPSLNRELLKLPKPFQVWRFLDSLQFAGGLIHYDEVHLNLKGQQAASRDLSVHLEL